MFSKPILDYTGAELRAHLAGFVRDGLTTYIETAAGVSALQTTYFSDIRFPGVTSIVDGMLRGWANSLQAIASRQNNEGTDAIITLHMPQDGINYPFSVSDSGLFHAWLDLGEHQGIDQYMDMLERTLEQTDFEAMAASIDRQADSLVDLGLKGAARDLCDFMNLTHRHMPAKLKAKGLEFEQYGGCSSEGLDRYHLQEGIRKNISSFVIAERETGIDGLEDGFLAIARGLHGYSAIQEIPSRTTFGFGPVSAVTFKHKTRFTIAPDAADALLSFIALHGDVELPNLKQAA
jgi:hypothetical protein